MVVVVKGGAARTGETKERSDRDRWGRKAGRERGKRRERQGGREGGREYTGQVNSGRCEILTPCLKVVIPQPAAAAAPPPPPHLSCTLIPYVFPPARPELLVVTGARDVFYECDILSFVILFIFLFFYFASSSVGWFFLKVKLHCVCGFFFSLSLSLSGYFICIYPLFYS